VRHIFYRILEKAKLRRVRFHDLRHTFASMLIENGENLAYVKDQLGHSTIAWRHARFVCRVPDRPERDGRVQARRLPRARAFRRGQCFTIAKAP
jgi:integrase